MARPGFYVNGEKPLGDNGSDCASAKEELASLGLV
jgi:hypothetical protein